MTDHERASLMNGYRTSYLVCALLFDMVMIVLAVAAPIWLTPGSYWWTAFALMCFTAASSALSSRLDKWDEQDYAAKILKERL